MITFSVFMEVPSCLLPRVGPMTKLGWIVTCGYRAVCWQTVALSNGHDVHQHKACKTSLAVLLVSENAHLSLMKGALPDQCHAPDSAPMLPSQPVSVRMPFVITSA